MTLSGLSQFTRSSRDGDGLLERLLTPDCGLVVSLGESRDLASHTGRMIFTRLTSALR